MIGSHEAETAAGTKFDERFILPAIKAQGEDPAGQTMVEFASMRVSHE